MKKFFILFIIFVLAIAFSGCNAEDAPKENISELEWDILTPEGIKPQPSDEPKEESDPAAAFILGSGGSEKILKKGESLGDWVLEELAVQYFENGKVSDITGKFSGEATVDGFIKKNELLENAYTFSADIYEREKLPYLVSPEGICDGSEFIIDIPETAADFPELRYGEELYCRVTVKGFSFDFGYRTSADGLDVTDIELLSEIEADFTLGTKGEAKTLRLGDTIGDWKVEKILIYTYGETNSEYHNKNADFSGSVTLEGYAEHNSLGIYMFYVNEDEWNKMPFYTSKDFTQDYCEFRMVFPEGENPINLDYDEKVKCKVTISSYSFNRAPMMAMPSAVIEEISIIE